MSKGHTDAAGCSSATASSGGTSGAGTLVVATAGEPDTLNPVLNYGPVRPAPGEVVDAGDRLVLAANEK
ncbi:hypothetical protein ACSNOB_05070 [Micromonospora sp. URMC 106]|uniref:hypothetical protein n=1 Tax=Micromonospora sp. URMC 106 TaxID=3423408 RepID=UPI003F1ACDE7